jgi:type III secretion protein U
MSDDSEEKTLEPSQHKLKEARKKGQVAQSSDFVQSMTTVAGIFYIILNWTNFSESFSGLYQLSVLSFREDVTEIGLSLFLTVVFDVMYAIVPFAALVIMIGLVANLLDKQGIPFSLEPLKPDFKKVNPAEGFKKLFKKRNMVEFVSSLTKLVFWFVITFVFIWLFLQTILASLYCSIGCIADSAISAGTLILATAVVMLLLFGLLDMPLQKMLFHDEQKMGHKEAKREQKEINGSPEFKQHQKSEHRRMIAEVSGEAVGSGQIRDGTSGLTMILRGSESAVGIYFHPEHSKVPALVKTFSGVRFARDMKAADNKNIPVIFDQALMSDILSSVEVGKAIRERHFEKVARVLIDIGAF